MPVAWVNLSASCCANGMGVAVAQFDLPLAERRQPVGLVDRQRRARAHKRE